MKKIINTIIISLIIQFASYGQYPTLNPEWTYIRADNTGISGDYHETVRGDRFGNMWTGGYLPFWSQGSLVRFDGTTFTNWGTYSENYLPDDRISNIAFDSNDRIWVGTQNGLATSADGISWQHYTSSNSTLQYDAIKGIAIEQDNDVWVVTGEWGSILDGGVGYYNGSSWTFYTSSNSNLHTQSLSDIAIDQQNNKWIACNSGLIKFDGFNWIQYTSANSGLSPGSPSEVMIDSLNRVWVCNGSNIDIFDGVNWTHINNSTWPVSNFDATSMYIRGDKMIFAETTNSSRIMWFDGTNWNWEWTNYFLMSSYIDINGNFWVSGNGVVRCYKDNQWINYTRYNTGLAENINENIFVDSKNRKWFANGNGGIQVFDCPNWESYGPWNENLFPSPQSMTTIGSSVCEAPNGDIWMTYDGTYGYAVRIPDGDYWNYTAWEIFDQTNSHPFFQEPKEAAVTDSGKVFFRTYWNNVFVFDYATGSWSLYDASNGIAITPTCLAPKSGGKMYLGYYNGIYIYDNGVVTDWNLSSVGITYIYDIEFDADNNMWLGTWEGLWKYDGTNWTNWNTSNSNLAANPVWAVEIDKVRGIIYAGAHNTQTWPYYGGLSYFNGTGNVFSTFLEGSSPISHKQVEDLTLDAYGNIWILTQSEGVNVHNPDGVIGFDCIDKTLQTAISTNIKRNGIDELHSARAIPNPFSGNTDLEFDLAESMDVSISVVDLTGREVKSISSGYFRKGKNKIRMELSNLKSGIYLCRVIGKNFNQSVKLVKE